MVSSRESVFTTSRAARLGEVGPGRKPETWRSFSARTSKSQVSWPVVIFTRALCCLGLSQSYTASFSRPFHSICHSPMVSLSKAKSAVKYFGQLTTVNHQLANINSIQILSGVYSFPYQPSPEGRVWQESIRDSSLLFPSGESPMWSSRSGAAWPAGRVVRGDCQACLSTSLSRSSLSSS